MIIMVALGMLSLSAVEIRKYGQRDHTSTAQANARLALMLALGELQKQAGPDQRSTARAAVLESAGNTIPNRNWLGVWETTYSQNSREWPVIGKAPAGASNGSPYALRGAYEDLRHTESSLNGGKWRDEMRLAWLVSKRTGSLDATVALDPDDENVVELLGRGTIGNDIGDVEFSRNRILVEKVDMGTGGALAWHVSDESQKASIAPVVDPRADALEFEAAAQANPALVKIGEVTPFGELKAKLKEHERKLITFESVALALGEQGGWAEFKQIGNHFTVDSGGLFTNPVTGGLKRDLTPLLLAKKSDPSVDFGLASGGSTRTFSSRLPIIPGQEHGVLGPGFDALRDWAQHAHADLQDAETSHTAAAIRTRPTTHWAHGISDGATTDAASWGAEAPKIHPVMTDVRWHYYFSIQNNRVRTHIIPRVCLWNPYSRSLKTPDLTVLMPNPYYQLSHGMHFYPEESHVDDLKVQYQSNSSHPFTQWAMRGGYVGGQVYKMRTNPFPTERYLAFTLESSTLGPGECHVFSPKVTNAQESASGVSLQGYQQSNPAGNVLSSKSPQGMDHFFYDHAPSVSYEVQGSSWRTLSQSQIDEIDLARVFDYQPEVVMQSNGRVESFPFVLKSGASANLSQLYTSDAHPTLQLVHFGGGGAHSNTYFGYIGTSWGSANQQDNSFGYLEEFSDAPLKNAPVTHQVGAKMLWLDEDGSEGNAPPLRVGRWTPGHMALNVAPVANWNVRAQIVSRSPASQGSEKWYMTGAGAWFLQFVPYSPQDVNDQPSLSADGSFVKNPFGASIDFSFFPNVTLFDLPSAEHGALSLARLRHALLSPYSWNPSYIVGHSLRDLHAPSDRTAHEVAADPHSGGGFPTRWDSLLGAARGGSSHGVYAALADSQGLLQIGNQAATKTAAANTFSSEDEILAYDIAYEVNQNLWDSFFLSTIPLASDTESFDWDADEALTNPRYRFNGDGAVEKSDVATIIGGPDGLEKGFYRSAEFLENSAAFNVNSTSVTAWIAFLSSSLGKNRPLSTGEMGEDEISFARHLLPAAAADTNQASLDSSGAWAGARKLSNDEVRALAEKIVEEVKKRGPFVSIADFINRRLADEKDETSHMGALDAAIKAAGLNANFLTDAKYLTTAVNSSGDAPDNNLSDFKNGYRYTGTDGQFTTTQPQSQAWGMPGYLTQGDLLEPLAPALTTRGDTFVIRAYGESKDGNGIRARAWIEAKVVRTPRYVEHRDTDATGTDGNTPLDAALEVDFSSGELLEGNLSDANKRFGRKFKLKSFRWLNSDEI